MIPVVIWNEYHTSVFAVHWEIITTHVTIIFSCVHHKAEILFTELTDNRCDLFPISTTLHVNFIIFPLLHLQSYYALYSYLRHVHTTKVM